jgi:S1-C subfamily serine protease
MRAIASAVAVVLGLSLTVAVATAAEDKKDQPEHGSGEKLKHYIQLKGKFDKDGFHISAIKEGGPGQMLKKEAKGDPMAMLEAGDVIVEVNGTKIKSQADYAKAMNSAKDPDNIEIKVKDVNSGEVGTWYASSKSEPFDD